MSTCVDFVSHLLLSIHEEMKLDIELKVRSDRKKHDAKTNEQGREVEVVAASIELAHNESCKLKCCKESEDAFGKLLDQHLLIEVDRTIHFEFIQSDATLEVYKHEQ